MKNWENFCIDAAEFRLTPKHLDSIREFYGKMDAAFFDSVFAGIPGPVPKQEIEARFPNSEYRKFNFILIASAWTKLKALYAGKGYPDRMLEDVRSDLYCWAEKAMEDFGYAGLDWRIFSWESDVLTGKVLQFGRLQCNIPDRFTPEFSLVRSGSDFSVVSGEKAVPGAVLSHGDPVINIHIPASGPLLRELCLDSLRKIRTFSKEFLPDFDCKAFVCYSWVLDPVFAEIIPTSNLICFQRLGHLFPLACDQTQEVIWRVFGKTAQENGIDQVPCRTSMQRAVAKHLKNGGKFTEYGMFILKEEWDSLLGDKNRAGRVAE